MHLPASLSQSLAACGNLNQNELKRNIIENSVTLATLWLCGAPHRYCTFPLPQKVLDRNALGRGLLDACPGSKHGAWLIVGAQKMFVELSWTCALEGVREPADH